MRFFNIDAHVSVIEDVAFNLRKHGHEVDSHLLSGHNWALDRPRGSMGNGEGPNGKVGYKSMNLTRWESFAHDFPDPCKRIKEFQDESPELAAYDGFIATYPPAMALLYDRFPGHTIVDIPIRYEHFFTNRPEAWHAFNEFLVKGIEVGRITVVANSVYDAMYFEYFTGCQIPMVETTCAYIDRLSSKWCPTGPNSLAFGEHPGCRMLASKVPGLHFVRDVPALGQYKHQDIVSARLFVWVPYTSSIMSFYEHYWLQVPMFVPSKKYLLQLADERFGDMPLALSTLSFQEKPLGGSVIKITHDFVGRDWRWVPDPHTREGRESWLDFYDFYRLPHITYFDSPEDLADKMASTSTSELWEISRAMGRENERRQKVVSDQWAQILERRVTDISGGASFPRTVSSEVVKTKPVAAKKGVVVTLGEWTSTSEWTTKK